MIAIIADDFTGAAELAGIGLRYNLKTEVCIQRAQQNNADLLVVCTDSRSLNKASAEKITADVLKKIMLQNPEMIYKKIDSVFRGHVLSELKIQMDELGLNKSLIVAANPLLGRTITDGKYFINNIPVNETGFAGDPEFAITSSSVLEMLGDNNGQVKVLKHADELPEEDIIVGEAETEEDIQAWAMKTNKDFVLAGAGDFFAALLNNRFALATQPAATLQVPYLYVSGTAFNKSRAFIKQLKNRLQCVSYLSPVMMKNENANDEKWLQEVSGIIKQQKKAVIAVDEQAAASLNISASSLKNTMARAVKQVADKENIKEMFIEGGSTAAAILKELEINCLIPVNELERGVVRMKSKQQNLYITVKPGSYKLPEQILKLYQ